MEVATPEQQAKRMGELVKGYGRNFRAIAVLRQKKKTVSALRAHHPTNAIAHGPLSMASRPAITGGKH
jgi:hypothetical protein